MTSKDKKTYRQMFDTNSDKTILFVTSDNQIFWEKQHAQAHSQGLSNRQIVEVTRENAMLIESDEDQLAEIESKIDALSDEIGAKMKEGRELDARAIELRKAIAEKNKTSETTEAEEEEEEDPGKGKTAGKDKGKAKK